MCLIRKSVVRLLVGLVLVALARSGEAHDQVPGTPQSRPILIQGATLHTVDGDVIPCGSILFNEGKITAIGATIRAKKKMHVIDGSGMHVYPGLIESMTDLGLREISSIKESADHSELGLENPNVRSWVAVNPDSELIPVARAGGVLTAHVAPSGRFLCGQTAVMNLDGWTAAEMSLKAPAGLCVSWDYLTPKGDEDAELVQLRETRLRELDRWFDDAERYAAAKAEAVESQSMDAFDVDVRLESLIPVLQRDLPIMAKADRLAAIESAVAFAQARSLRLVIYGGYDAPACASILKRADIPVIVASTYRTPQRRDDAYDASYTLPARLQSVGVRFAIAGEGAGYPGGASNTRNLPYHAACAIAYGLDKQIAIRAITLSAAEILGVDDRLGSLTKGKDATLIMVDGDVMESDTHVVRAFIQGRQVDLSNRHELLFQKYRQKYVRER